MSRTRRLLAAGLFAILAPAARAADGASAGTPQPVRVTIAFTADASGYLEPCG